MEGLLNLVLGLHLKSANIQKCNYPGIDLLDRANKVVVQVTSEYSKEKIDHSLTREGLKAFGGYTFYFVTLCVHDFSTPNYENPYSLTYTASNFLDLAKLLGLIEAMDVDQQERVYLLLQKESSVRNKNLDPSEMTEVINSLAKNPNPPSFTGRFPNAFEPQEKIAFNGLGDAEDVLKGLAVYTFYVDKIYNDLASQGCDVSAVVLNKIVSYFQDNKLKSSSKYKWFSDTVNDVLNDCFSNVSVNPKATYDQLFFDSQILVMNAFLRCRIFEDPKGYSYVAAK